MKDQRPLIPVVSAKSPKYPTQEQVFLRPSMLCAAPQRWKKQPMVCAALLFTVATGLAGCSAPVSNNSPDSTASAQPALGDTSNPTEISVNASPKASSETPAEAFSGGSEASTPDNLSDLTIPVFEHGTGRGSYGCVSVAPPVFLSEEEALQVITEEAAAQGVHFTAAKTISGTFPATSTTPGTQSPGSYQGELKLDGYDAALEIGVEFVSQQDVADWNQPEEGVWASVEQFDMLDTAQRLSEAAPGVAVFYDPTSQDYQDFEQVYSNQEDAYVAAQKEKSIEDLRAQVRDFLQWLAAQGVI